MALLVITFLIGIQCQANANQDITPWKSDENNACEEQCEIAFINCIADCDNDIECLSKCNRIQTECIENCSSSSSNAVLILSTFHPDNKPLVVDFQGNVNDDLDFQYEEGATAALGCGATLMGEFWYFGDGKKVSKINGCKLVRQPDLTFGVNYPSCNTFSEPQQKVLICFGSESTYRICHSFDGENYDSVEPSKNSHQHTYALGNYKNKALATGCYKSWANCSFSTELLDMKTLKWTDGPDYPFGNTKISEYSTAHSPEAAYIIGGPYTENVVAQFKNDQWNKLDDLNQGRVSHGSITVGSRTMIVGGYWKNFQTEVWEFENGSNKIIQPTLTEYHLGIGLFAVDINFCRKCPSKFCDDLSDSGNYLNK